MGVLLVRPKDVVPQHQVLAVVDGGHHMVLVVELDVEDAQERDGVACVVERRDDAADDDKQCGCDDVAGHQEDGEEVVILSADELDRVHVDSVRVATRGGVLSVVVLVDVLVDRAEVECAVEEVVEEVVDSCGAKNQVRGLVLGTLRGREEGGKSLTEESPKRYDRVEHCQLIHSLQRGASEGQRAALLRIG